MARKKRGPRYPKEEYARMAQEIYDVAVRPHLKPTDKGRFVSVDIETGEYEIDDSDYEATMRLWNRMPDPQPFLFRVGYRSAHKMGGRMVPDAKWKSS